ncbi:radical SAM protein [Candidatus Bathyarchaeota archaeon ex4484_135]|nr:MAG: radical SAM protein [Candidatus Bathyarchaeota archaeon ex4484_135]
MPLGHKWKVLVLASRWDRCYVPLYEASAGGRKVRLLKTLMTNSCRSECLYCPLRCLSAREKRAWKPDKLARVAVRLWREGTIEGVFLSSSIPRDPDSSVELELEAVRALRSMGFTGYVHLRLMPGTSRHLVREAVELADRVGVNLEAPDESLFDQICPDKGSFRTDILKRLEWAAEEARSLAQGARRRPYGACRAGLDTQVVVGVLEDNDLDFIYMTDWLFRKLNLRRVYFSPFEPVKGTPLEDRPPCPRKRVLRLYQASFLLRDYGVRAWELAELVQDGRLPDEDPKVALAKLQADRFPVNPNTADFWELVRVPGIGPSAAKEIIALRESGKTVRDFWDLAALIGRERARRAIRYLDLEYPGLGQH